MKQTKYKNKAVNTSFGRFDSIKEWKWYTHCWLCGNAGKSKIYAGR